MNNTGGISNFRSLLHNISENLVSDNVECLKFLCDGTLTKARLEKIRNARELFVAIGEVIHDEREQLQFLKWLFETISRFDLKFKVEEYLRKAEARDGGQHDEIGVDAAPDPAPFQSNAAPDPGPLADMQDPVQPHDDQYPYVQWTENPSPVSEYPFATTRSVKDKPVTIPEDVHVPPGTINSQATSWKFPTQQVNSDRNPFLADYSENLPQNPTHTNPFLQGFGENYQLPGHSTGTNPFQRHAPEKFQIPQASAVNYSSQQDFATAYSLPSNSIERLHPQQSVPFGQQEKFPLEVENLKIEPVNLSESVAQPFQDLAVSQLRNQESKNIAVIPEYSDQPDRGRQSIQSGKHQDALTSGTNFDENLAFPGPQAKVPVERCISGDFNDAGVYCSHKKCPVEMSYGAIKTFRGAKQLGKGGFGVVYEGAKTFHGQHVVVKEAYDSHCGQAHSSGQLKREKRVGYIKHPHLMPLYAFSEEKGKPCCLMYPKMATDLDKALRMDLCGKKKLPWEYRVRIALHTARALKYLHTEVKNEKNVRQEIVHMDVKPGNIFLDESFNARLGDAGMAQELPMGYSFASLSQMRGTLGYLDPANFDGRHFRPSNDIFSYGVVLLQLLTQRKAVEKTWQSKEEPLHRVLEKEDVLSDPDKFMTRVKQNVWPDSGEDKNYTKEFAAIAIDCLRPPAERAKLPDICRRLEAILERRGVAKLSKPREGARCMSCLLNHPAKYFVVKSSECDGDRNQHCNYFCVTCLTQARRNPLECPSHGPAEPLIGGSDIYAVLVCGNDSYSSTNAAVFERDLCGIKSVLADTRIVGIWSDHMYCIKPQSSGIKSQAAEVLTTLDSLKEQLKDKRDVFLYFYFSGHSDQKGNLICSSEKDLLTEMELRKALDLLKGNVGEFLIILDCCYADGKITSEHIEDEAFLVHKSSGSVVAAEVESPHPLPLESLCGKLHSSEECVPAEGPISTTEQCCEADADTLDGSVFSKAPLANTAITVRQWSSSLREQQSFGKSKGNSFLTQYIILGLKGAHKCPFAKPKCFFCDTFKAKAKSVGYISASNLEDFVSKHVERAATKAGGRHQNPQMRTLHSKETVLAYYNEESLCDKIIFKSSSSDLQAIRVDAKLFPLTPEKLQLEVFPQVQGKLPNGAQPKHLQTLCDGEEILPTSDVHLIDFIRQGYDVQCQFRPCSCIFSGPLVLEVKNCRDSITDLLTCLGFKKSQDIYTLEVNTSQMYEDMIKEFLEDNSNASLGDLLEDLTVLITTSSQRKGTLMICVLHDSLDCSFQATT